MRAGACVCVCLWVCVCVCVEEGEAEREGERGRKREMVCLSMIRRKKIPPQRGTTTTATTTTITRRKKSKRKMIVYKRRKRDRKGEKQRRTGFRWSPPGRKKIWINNLNFLWGVVMEKDPLSPQRSERETSKVKMRKLFQNFWQVFLLSRTKSSAGFLSTFAEFWRKLSQFWNLIVVLLSCR